jgi:hypothetical protein
LNEACVPIEKVMETTSHRSMDAYEKYNQEKKLFFGRATQRVLSREVKNGRPIMYQDTYKDELEQWEAKVAFARYYFSSFCCFVYFNLFVLCGCSDQVLLEMEL